MQVTIRAVKEEWVAKAKEKARERGVSMNEVMRSALASGLGLADTRPRKTNLDKYAGASNLGDHWEKYLDEELQQIDEEMWK